MLEFDRPFRQRVEPVRSISHVWLADVVDNGAAKPYLDLGVMRDGRLPVLGWNCDLPYTVCILLHGHFFPVPVI